MDALLIGIEQKSDLQYLKELIRRLGFKAEIITKDFLIPNKETVKVFKETDKGKKLVKCKNTTEMFEKLGI